MAERKDQKARERDYLDTVRGLYSDFPLGHLRDALSPDFLLEVADRTLGIEVIEFIRFWNDTGTSLRHFDIAEQRITVRAKHFFDEMCSTPVCVHTHWFRPRILDMRRYDEIAQAIANFVVAKVEESGPDLPIHSALTFSSEGALAQTMFKVVIMFARPEDELQWNATQYGPMGVTRQEFQNRIDIKNLKADGYRLNCDEVWLLIVADREHVSSCVYIEPDLLFHDYTSKFDRTLLYDAYLSKVYVLPARKLVDPSV